MPQNAHRICNHWRSSIGCGDIVAGRLSCRTLKWELNQRTSQMQYLHALLAEACSVEVEIVGQGVSHAEIMEIRHVGHGEYSNSMHHATQDQLQDGPSRQQLRHSAVQKPPEASHPLKHDGSRPSAGQLCCQAWASLHGPVCYGQALHY